MKESYELVKRLYLVSDPVEHLLHGIELCVDQLREIVAFPAYHVDLLLAVLAEYSSLIGLILYLLRELRKASV